MNEYRIVMETKFSTRDTSHTFTSSTMETHAGNKEMSSMVNPSSHVRSDRREGLPHMRIGPDVGYEISAMTRNAKTGDLHDVNISHDHTRAGHNSCRPLSKIDQIGICYRLACTPLTPHK
jgi:hypothetical protein